MRTASEIDAAKAVLTTTDLGAVTSEVRQFPPGYVTGGRLKLNTNLQIEVAPIAINIAGKDVRIAETVIIGNEHWIIDGVETPRVPGSWYYLYLSTAGQFGVSPNAPTYNALYFAYYHPAISDLRAIGKFYFGDDGTVLYVQTSLETASAQVLVAASTYTGEDANYYCTGTHDELFLQCANYFLSEFSSGGKISITPGTFNIYNAIVAASNIDWQLTSHTILNKKGNCLVFNIQGTTTSFLDNIKIEGGIIQRDSTANDSGTNLYFIWVQYSSNISIAQVCFKNGLGIYIRSNDCINLEIAKNVFMYADYLEDIGDIGSPSQAQALYNIDTAGIGQGTNAHIIIKDNYLYNLYKGIESDAHNSVIENNYLYNIYVWGILNQGDYVSVLNNKIIDSWKSKTYSNSGWGAGEEGAISNQGLSNTISKNLCLNNGQLLDQGGCNSSTTYPMIFGEAAPTASNCTWGFTATGPYEGVGCYRFTKTVAAGTVARLHLVDNVGAADVHGLIPGTQYEWGGWIKVAASASCGFQGFRLYQATTGAGAASAVAFTTATTGWQWLAVTATVYVGATTAYIGLIASASLATMSFDVDNLRLFPPGITNVHNQNYYNGGSQTYDGL